MAKPKANRPRSRPIQTGEIVLSAIKKLMKNTGWTARTIVKFIRLEYGENSPTLSQRVSRALKRGVRLGLLEKAGGRYRLHVMSRLVRPVKPRKLRSRAPVHPRETGVRMRSRSRSS